MTETTADFNAWKITGWVEIFYFAAVGLASVHLLYKAYRHSYSFTRMMIFVGILVSAKISAAACCVAFLSTSIANANGNLAVAYIILNTIAVGFFLRLLLIGLKFIDAMHSDEFSDQDTRLTYNEEFHNDDVYKYEEQETPMDYEALRYSKKQWKKVSQQKEAPAPSSIYTVPLLERVIGPFVLVSVILCGTGGGIASGGGEETGKKILEIGSLFYLVSLVTMFLMTCYKLRIYRKMTNRKYDIGTVLVLYLITIPFILIRIIYSILSAFTFSSYFGPTVSKFAQLFGDWKIYVGMAFVEECIAIALLLVALEISIHRMS